MYIEDDLKHFSNGMLKEELKTINILKTIINEHLQNSFVKNELKKALNAYKNIINNQIKE